MMLYATKGPGDLDFLTWLPENGPANVGSSVRHAYGEISRYLADRGLQIIQERIFGDLQSAASVMDGRAQALGGGHPTMVDPTYIEGRPCFDGAVAGIHVIAARLGASDGSNLVTWNKTPCGYRVDGAEASYLGLSDVANLLAPKDRSPGSEAGDTLRLTARVLEAEGWSISDVCRTWFYLDDILAWYDEFNDARNTVFLDLGLLNGSLPGVIPASTGIRGRNPKKHRCTLDLVAVRPIHRRRLAIDMLHNPLQNEAPEYGSAFSRGLTVATESCRYFFVSGTASIDEAGSTVHPGDFDSQTRRTLDNVESLLASRGAVMDNICQATAFVKRPDDIHRLHGILAARGLERLPLICTVDDVCREDLLVEIDATAMIPHRFGNDV